MALPSISEKFGPQTAQISRRLSSRTWEVNVVDPTRDPDWDQLVASHPDSGFFHSAAWARVLSETYGHKPFSLLLSRNGEPVALVPLLEVNSSLTGRRGVSLPFTDFCDPLLFDGCDTGVVLKLLCELARSRDWKHFEIRGGLTSTPRATPSTTFYGHTLDLRSGPEALFTAFTGSVRRAIRRAELSDLNVQPSRSRQGMLDFYRLHARTRQRHGLPPQPVSFFLKIHDEVIKPGLGFVMLATKESKPVAASVFFHTKTKAVYKFGASDERRQDLRGNNLVMWNAIRYLAQNGIEALHLGRTSRENEGLRRFKRGWGAVEETIEYCRFGRSENNWITSPDKVSGFHNAVFSRLPVALNRLIGTMIYPHLD